MTMTAEEGRYWDREKLGLEAGGLMRTLDALEKAVAEIEALPSRGGEIVGEPGVSDEDLATLRGIMDRVGVECDRACEHGDDPGDDPMDDGTIGYDYYGPSWPTRDI